MPSQNESILRHPKVACLGSIIARSRIDLGLLVSQEMAMRAKQTHTSLYFPVLITELGRRSAVPQDPASNIDVTSSSSTDIQRIEAEFRREEVDRRRAALADTSPEVDVNSLPAEAPSSTPTSELSAYLKATGFTTLKQGADDKDASETSGISSAITGDVQKDDVGHAESETETDEEGMAVRDEVVREPRGQHIQRLPESCGDGCVVGNSDSAD
uniref:Putative plant transposon protein domain-containing protein n=1 Tax=Solanum tuberosum TaxID=4113 RepID=M1DHV0_SOLTU